MGTSSQHSITIRQRDAARGRTEYITRRKVPSGLRPLLGPPTGLRPRSWVPQLASGCSSHGVRMRLSCAVSARGYEKI